MSDREQLSLLRIGLIGVGSRGTWLAHEAKRSGLAEIVSAYDPDPVNAGKWQQQRQVHLPLVSRKELLTMPLME